MNTSEDNATQPLSGVEIRTPESHDGGFTPHQRYSIYIAFGMFVVAILTLLLSFWQFALARAERKETAIALKRATKAQETSERAEQSITDHERAILDLRIQLEDSARLSTLNDLTIRAQSGDRAAFIELQEYVHDSSPEEEGRGDFYISFAQKNVGRILAQFSGKLTQDQFHSFTGPRYPLIWPPEDIPVNLESDSYISRALAVGVIHNMRLYSFIPDLADLAFTEPDLDLLQHIVYTINSAFRDHAPRTGFTIKDFLYPHYNGREKFEKQWKRFGHMILERKPLYVVEEQTKGDLFNMRIVDPEDEP